MEGERCAATPAGCVSGASAAPGEVAPGGSGPVMPGQEDQRPACSKQPPLDDPARLKELLYRSDLVGRSGGPSYLPSTRM